MRRLPDLDVLLAQVERLASELERRKKRHATLEPYFELDPSRRPIPPAVTEARLVKAYKTLMAMSEVPWGKLIVDSKLDRLEVAGIRSDDKTVDDAVWGVWQDNAMDLESKLAHAAALLDGRANALVWPDEAGNVEISLDDATQMVVEYREGSRRHRVGALRSWCDDDKQQFATLYRPDGLWKFQAVKARRGSKAKWEPRDGDEFVKNPWGVVPAVELRVNGRLKAGRFPHARGEYEDVSGLMDRINLLTFLGLIVAVYLGFPLRGVIGEEMRTKVLVDDDGNPMFDAEGNERTEPVAAFDAHADSYFQLENPDAKIAEFKAAERKNLSVFDELSQLAAATATPRHYFPMDGGISNVSEPTIRAFEGGMHAKVNASHKPSLGEGWEEVLRLGGKMLDQPVELSPRAELQWRDHESRSLGERADAALKLGQAGLPWVAVAEKALNLSQDEIRRYAAEQSSGALARLLEAAQTPVPQPGAAPALNGDAG